MLLMRRCKRDMNLSEATVSWIGVPVTVLGVVRGRCVGQRRWGREGRHRSKIIIQMAVGYGKQGGGLNDGNGRRPVVKEITGLAPVLRKSFSLGTIQIKGVPVILKTVGRALWTRSR